MIFSKLKKITIIFSLILSLVAFSVVKAAGTDSHGSYNFGRDSGLRATSQSAGYSQALAQLTPLGAAANIIKIILAFLGIIFLGLTIYGGMAWMLAAGNEQELTKAKKIITGAITGLIIVLIAYALTYAIVTFFYSRNMSLSP